MQGPYLRKYGAATTVPITLFEVDGVDFRVDAVHATGDSKMTKDEGAEANTGSGFVDEGSGYSLALTATEMQAARIQIHFIDQTATKVWLDTTLVIETYGHASAQHAVDLDDGVRAGLTALPNAVAEAAGGLYTRGTGAGQIKQTANGQVDVNVAAMVANVLTATAINTDAITAAKIAADALGASELAADAANEIADAILARTITESYSALAAEPTVAQAFYQIMQGVLEFSISGTTLSVKKLDGTEAFSVTLDSVTPASRVRAT